MKYLVNGEETEIKHDSTVSVSRLGDRLIVHAGGQTHTALSIRRGETTYVSYRGQIYVIEKPGSKRHSGGVAQTGELRAPMPGQVVDILVAEGASVEPGDKLLVLEAMKTHQPVLAPFPGIVASLPVTVGDQVSEGQLLAKVEPT